MAYTTTYATLLSDIQDIVDSDEPEFVAQIPNIIARAQDILQRDLGLEIFRSFVNSTMTTGVGTIARNASWLNVSSIRMADAGYYLEPRTNDWVRMYGTTQGVPKYYSETDETTIRIAPIPNGAYEYAVEVINRLPNLSPSNQTNWLTRNAADLLLLLCLVGAESYLNSTERVAEFMQFYQMLLASATQELRSQERAGYTPTREASRPSMSPGERK